MKRIAMLLVATGIAGAASAHDEHGGPQHRGCSAIEVTAPGLEKQPRDLRFATSRILDLDFETRFEKPVHGDHLLHFKVFTPSGFLYQDLTVPFTWRKPGRGPHDATDDAQAVRTVASFPRGVPVQQLGETAGRGGHRRDTVHARLPVAGTSITMSTLYGRWTVQAFLDDRTRPCSPPRHFTIHAK
jgi:hypothetical protein